MCIRGVHFLRRQSRKPLVASARTAGHGLVPSTWGKSSPMKFNNVTGAHLDTNTAHYLHLKNSALTRRLAEDPAQDREINSRKGGGWGALFLSSSNVKRGKNERIERFHTLIQCYVIGREGTLSPPVQQPAALKVMVGNGKKQQQVTLVPPQGIPGKVSSDASLWVAASVYPCSCHSPTFLTPASVSINSWEGYQASFSFQGHFETLTTEIFLWFAEKGFPHCSCPWHIHTGGSAHTSPHLSWYSNTVLLVLQPLLSLSFRPQDALIAFHSRACL